MAEAKAIVNKIIHLTLDLSEDEAETLMLMVQNPIDCTDCTETKAEKDVRAAVFRSLHDVIFS